MKKLLLLVFIMANIGLKAQEVLQKDKVTQTETPVLSQLATAGQHLSDAGKMKNWSIFTAAASMFCFYLDAKATEKDGSIYKIGGGVFGITSLGLMIGSNIKITIAGKKLKQLKLQ